MPGHGTVSRRCGYAGACQFPRGCAGFANFSRWAGMVKPGWAAARRRTRTPNIERRTSNVERRTEEEEEEARGIFSSVRRWKFGVGRSVFGFWSTGSYVCSMLRTPVKSPCSVSSSTSRRCAGGWVYRNRSFEIACYRSSFRRLSIPDGTGGRKSVFRPHGRTLVLMQFSCNRSSMK